MAQIKRFLFTALTKIFHGWPLTKKNLHPLPKNFLSMAKDIDTFKVERYELCNFQLFLAGFKLQASINQRMQFAMQ